MSEALFEQYDVIPSSCGTERGLCSLKAIMVRALNGNLTFKNCHSIPGYNVGCGTNHYKAKQSLEEGFLNLLPCSYLQLGGCLLNITERRFPA